MYTRIGDLYPSYDAAIANGVPAEAIVKLEGPKAAVKKVSKAVKAQTKNQRKRERRKARKGKHS